MQPVDVANAWSIFKKEEGLHLNKTKPSELSKAKMILSHLKTKRM